MNRIITDNMYQIWMICEQQHIQSLFVFGSVCGNRFNDESDIDLLVSFKPLDYADYADNYFQTAERFEKVFQRPVDLVTEKSLKNPYFIETVNQTKVLLYGQ
ncbi:MAG: nucleotidyltransferase domain-containing protein [Candidatus Azobacteroides sp.]|nr:nucleotidyltransferase domain-containing protein [Candidatus Azobacteroides sp.]